MKLVVLKSDRRALGDSHRTGKGTTSVVPIAALKLNRALAPEVHDPRSESRTRCKIKLMTGRATHISRVGIIAGLMVASAISFLRYAGWAASYSGWYGLPSYAEKLKLAGNRAYFYFTITLFLQLVTFFLCWSLLPLNKSELPAGPKFLARIGLSATITIGGLVLLAVLINWIAMRLH
jgi:hypothetical protein